MRILWACISWASIFGDGKVNIYRAGVPVA
jgi:hypothetical protein